MFNFFNFRFGFRSNLKRDITIELGENIGVDAWKVQTWFEEYRFGFMSACPSGINADLHFIVISKVNQRINIGFIGSAAVDGKIELFIYISPKFRGKKFGYEALQLFIQKTPNTVLTAVTNPKNRQSRNLLKKSGFIAVGRDKLRPGLIKYRRS